MSKLLRRDFLKALPFAAGAVSLPTVALAKLAEVREMESPWGRADRLAHELAEALAEVDGGPWSAEIFGDGRAMNVMFRDDLEHRRIGDASPQERAIYHSNKLKQALNDETPGKWRTAIDYGSGFAIVVNDSHRKAFR